MVIDSKEIAGIYVFEGIDNVGKTTIIQKLKEKIIRELGYECTNIAFPGNEPMTLGSLVYDIHHFQEKYFDLSINATSLQLLHIAAHIDLIQRRIKKLCSSSNIILLDRFWWSTYVYGLSGGMEEDVIQAVLKPELIYWKDMNVKKIFLVERNNRDHDYDAKKEKEIVDRYRELASEEKRCIRIFNDDSLEETVQLIFDNILGD